MDEPLTLLTVHAHPDDEASKGAPTCAMYRAQGVRTVLVCCTGGEEGDLQNPKLAEPGGAFFGLEGDALKAKLAEVRAGAHNEQLDSYARSVMEHAAKGVELDLAWIDNLLSTERSNQQSFAREAK